ncbi:HD domain-containing protein [Aurantimicrobium minutum]|uniref:HD domain-containing protein n=1 Tax=Aurantimicrobium minutum TaxID=708131 RepID=UPI002473AB43|nr:HD domain-containing protein [Aurantimicrobium minutum]MDH6255810.1 HD superfamily phosphodiesterase [Aurantimicrobium minutum]
MSSPSHSPVVNHLGRDVTGKIPDASRVPGMIELNERDGAIWSLAKDFLRTRDNDAHSLYAYSIAQALLSQIPEADENIVLPAILLHDTGWSTVDERLALEAIAPGADDSLRHLIIQHEKEGARIAREILEQVGVPEEDIVQIVDIIDGHDTRLVTINTNDALVKDSDKVWRVTPHGRRVVMDWFGIDAEQSLRLCAYRAYNELFTDQAKAMSRVLVTTACMDFSEEIAHTYTREDVA